MNDTVIRIHRDENILALILGHYDNVRVPRAQLAYHSLTWRQGCHAGYESCEADGPSLIRHLCQLFFRKKSHLRRYRNQARPQ